jgi:hypothetical protein
LQKYFQKPRKKLSGIAWIVSLTAEGAEKSVNDEYQRNLTADYADKSGSVLRRELQSSD